MRLRALIVATLLGLAGIAAADCVTHTYFFPRGIVTCTTCCYESSCTTSCF
jgi:hypothetical protein